MQPQPNADLTPFERELVTADSSISLSTCVVLLWISACDGVISDSEVQQLSGFLPESEATFLRLMASIEAHDTDVLQLAMEHLRTALKPEHRALFLEFCILQVLADQTVHPNEAYILRLISDAMWIDEVEFRSFFEHISGVAWEAPSDMSRASFYRKQDTEDEQEQRERQHSHHARREVMSLEEACKILGVSRDADAKEIRHSYRRLAQLNHPDRFEQLGPAAVAAATEKFQQIEQAYRCLKVRHA